MNKKQLCIMWIGIVVIVLIGLFPPAERFFNLMAHPIWNDRFLFDLGNNKIQLNQLCIRWVIVAVITGGLIVTFKDKPKDKEKEGTEK